MVGKAPVYLHNDQGVPEIRVGAREMMCIGAYPPFDHPHVFLEMGEKMRMSCPYCGTVYVYDPNLKNNESLPESTYRP